MSIWLGALDDANVPGLEVFLAIVAELSRALAAARRHDSLRYGRGRQGGIAPADISRQIFEEFYAIQRDFEDAAIAPRQRPLSPSRPRRAEASGG